MAVSWFQNRESSEMRRFQLRRENRQSRILLCVALWSLISFLVFNRYVLATVVIQGTSMEPTLSEGDHLLLNRVKPLLGEIQRGELVVINDRGENEFAIKRVVGLPMDTIEFKDGMVFVNGKQLDEEYLPRNTRTYPPQGHSVYLLSSDSYFVLGDNRAVSEDSRYYGPVRRSKMLGVVID